MKKLTKYILAAALLTMALSARAQNFGPAYRGGDYRTSVARSRLINWLPQEETLQRFTIAVRPFQLMNDGLKLDFEFELKEPGQWLQLSFAGYVRTQFDPDKRNGDYYYYDPYYDGWSNFLSDFDVFEKFSGAGLGVAYKRMFSDSGWYWNAGMNFTYFDVTHKSWGYYAFYEDGMQFYEQDYRAVNTQYYKVGLNFTLGKHFALTRNLFVDGFVGIGGERTFKGGSMSRDFDYGMLSFGYSGIYFSGGFRIGWLWPNKR